MYSRHVERYVFLGTPLMRANGPSIKLVRAFYSQKVDRNVCIGGPSMGACLLERVQTNSDSAKHLTFVGKKSWVLGIHSDWSNLPWGQSKRYLPKSLREISDSIFPDYPDNQLLTFGMMQSILYSLEDILEAKGVARIDKHIDNLLQMSDGSLVAKIGDEEHTVCKTSNFHITNAALDIISPSDILAYNSGALYAKSREDSTDPIVIIGSGANLNWACRDFSGHRKIIHLIPPGDRERVDLKDILEASLSMRQCDINAISSKYVSIEGTDIITGKDVLVRVENDKVFSAMGYRHNPDLVKGITPSKVTNIDGTPRPSSIVSTYFFGTQEGAVRKPKDYRGTVVPDGNMALNHLKIKLGSGSYVANEANAILLFDAWRECIMQSVVAHGMTIDSSFFDAIEPKVKHIYTDFVPSPEQVNVILQSVYDKSRPVKDKDGNDVKWEEFFESISKPVEDELIVEANIVRGDDTMRIK